MCFQEIMHFDWWGFLATCCGFARPRHSLYLLWRADNAARQQCQSIDWTIALYPDTCRGMANEAGHNMR